MPIIDREEMLKVVSTVCKKHVMAKNLSLLTVPLPMPVLKGHTVLYDTDVDSQHYFQFELPCKFKRCSVPEFIHTSSIEKYLDDISSWNEVMCDIQEKVRLFTTYDPWARQTLMSIDFEARL